jgi:hypothetical protein
VSPPDRCRPSPLAAPGDGDANRTSRDWLRENSGPSYEHFEHCGRFSRRSALRNHQPVGVAAHPREVADNSIVQRGLQRFRRGTDTIRTFLGWRRGKRENPVRVCIDGCIDTTGSSWCP